MIAFDGRLRFDLRPACLGSQLATYADMQRLKTVLPVLSSEQENIFWEMFTLLNSTNAIVFQYRDIERAPMIRFRTWFEDRGKANDLAKWAAEYLTIAMPIIDAWRHAYTEAQVLFDNDPAEKPTEMLTEAEKKEVANDKSPLPSGGENLRAA